MFVVAASLLRPKNDEIMDAPALIRPEVQLNACPADGGTLVRLYAVAGVVFGCVTCGHRIGLDPQRTRADIEVLTAA